MVHLTRVLKVKFHSDADQDYLPKEMSKGEEYQVIGYSSKKRMVKTEKGNKEFEDIYFIIIGDKKKLVTVSEMNCSVRIEPESFNDSLIQTLKNIVALLGGLSEKVGKHSGGPSGEGGPKEG